MHECTIAECRLANEYPVIWTYGATGHRVVYGAEVHTHALYVDAAKSFNACTSHAWTNYALAHGIY